MTIYITTLFFLVIKMPTSRARVLTVSKLANMIENRLTANSIFSLLPGEPGVFWQIAETRKTH